MAPQRSRSPEPQGRPTQVYITFSTTTTVPSTASSTKKSAGARKNLKSSKTKTFDYQFSSRTPALESYTAFATALLTHSASAKYIPLLEKKRYISFKMSTKKIKNTASDVETPEEFNQIVKKSVVWDTGATKEIYIWLELDLVRVLWSKRNAAEDSDDDNESINDEDGNKNVDTLGELAHARKLLTDKWGNHHNQHLTYIDNRRGITWELTDPQIDTWVRHIADAKATVNDPPAVPEFDEEYRQPAIPAHKRPNRLASIAESAGELPPVSELGHAATIFQSIANILTNSTQKPLADTTAPGSIAVASESPVNSPSKLPRFLTYAKNKGVSHALQYQNVLKGVDFGPDILPLVGTDSLTNLGVSDGDAIRLKSLAADWWKSPEARCRSEPVKRPIEPDSDEEAPPAKCYHFEKRWPDDQGAHTLFGSGTKEIDDGAEPNDFTWFYHCEIRNMMVELPSHLEPILDGEDPADFDADY